MNVVGKVFSFHKGKDVFQIQGPKTIDHTWPLSKEGSDSIDNKKYLTEYSNNIKGNSTKGTINGIRFCVMETGRTVSQKIIGTMYVTGDDKNWYEVI